jgi:hypothetical protein
VRGIGDRGDTCIVKFRRRIRQGVGIGDSACVVVDKILVLHLVRRYPSPVARSLPEYEIT